MLCADIGRTLALLGVVAAWEVTGRIAPMSLAGVIVVLAVGEAAFRPAVQSIMPCLSPSAAMLPAINGMLDGTARLSRLLGPALIALAAAHLPAAHFLTLDAVSFAVSAIAVFSIGPRPTRSVRHPAGLPILQGFRAMRRHRLLRFLLHTSGINNGAWYASMFLGIPLLLARQGAGASAFGAVLACYGLTNLAGNLIVGSRPSAVRPARLVLCGNILTGAGIAWIGIAALLPAIPHASLYIGAIVAGAGGPMNDIPRTTLMQTALPTPDVGAAFRSWMVAANAGILAAMTVTPTVYRWTGPAIGIAVLGGIIVATGFAGLLLRLDGPPSANASALAETVKGASVDPIGVSADQVL